MQAHAGLQLCIISPTHSLWLNEMQFTSDLFLRKRQVDLIKEFYKVANTAGDAGAGTVHQVSETEGCSLS